MTRLLTALLWAVAIAYPILVYCGLKFAQPYVLGGVFLVLACLRLALPNPLAGGKLQALLLPLILALIACHVMLVNDSWLLRFYPVAVSALLLASFAYSLRVGPPIVERIARLREAQLSPRALRYTRHVTQAWCLFFIVNGSVALYTALYSSMEIWTLYNGALSYLAMALFFSVEYLLRRRLQRAEENADTA